MFAHSSRFLAIQKRCLVSKTTPLSIPSLNDFRDSEPREKRMQEPVGRSWSVRELRRKSFDDLHRLWHVLYKERNMLLTEHHLSQRKQIIMPQPERIQKTKKSMGAIRHVLGERKREKLARIAFARKEQVQGETSEMDVEDEFYLDGDEGLPKGSKDSS